MFHPDEHALAALIEGFPLVKAIVATSMGMMLAHARLGGEAPDVYRGFQDTFESLFGAVTDLIVVTDLEGTVLYLNPTALCILDRDEASIGQSLLTMVGQSDSNTCRRLVEESGTELIHDHVVLEGPDRRIDVDVDSRRVEVNDARFVLLTARPGGGADEARQHGLGDEDVELRVRYRTRELESANKELESFAYSISHDLRAPLRAINGFAEIVASRYSQELNPEGRRYLDNILQAGERMDLLIADLLKYARMGLKVADLVPVALDDVVREVCRTLQSRVSEEGALISFETGMPTVMADATLILQLFTNLVENSLTYRKADEPPEIIIHCTEDDETATVTVTDNGIGIDADHHEKVFRVFQRLHGPEEYTGTGIGLALVKKAADMLRGDVWLESTAGEGTTFYVRLNKHIV